MLDLIDTHPDTNVLEAEYKRLLGFPSHYVLGDRVRELADWARGWYAENGRPWVYARQTPVELAPDTLRINGAQFAARRVHDQLANAQAHAAFLVAVSAGKECEEQARRLWQEGKPDEYFFLEVFGSAVVEHLITNAGARICAWAEQHRMVALPHYSPGYSGWDISDQNRFFAALRPASSGAFPGSIRVLESGMLQPKKSLLALVGLTQRLDNVTRFAHLVPCEGCSFPNCQYRRTLYRQAVASLEDVRRLQPAPAELSSPVANGSALNHNATYSIHPRALRKWSQERLRLKVLNDQSVEAEFRYEGTTCSNLGCPLEFDYHVQLGPSRHGYPILRTDCFPHPGDTGHTRMCEYINNADALLSNIEQEKPLAGRLLNEVLSWQRPPSPAGCYCDSPSRFHKWGLVLEVIHYALVQQEKMALERDHVL